MPDVAAVTPAAPVAPPAAAKRFELPKDIPAATHAPAAAPAPEAATPPAEVQPDQNTAEQAPATAPDEDKPETPEQAAKRQGRRFERRLDKAYRKAAEAEARAKLLEQELQKRQQAASPASQDPGAPKVTDFEKIEDYEQAVRKHEREQAEKQFKAQFQTAAQQQAVTKIVEGWEARTAKADSKYEDFDEVVGEIKPTAPWAVAIMKADNGPDIAYYLGKNMKKAEAIAGMSPDAQIRAIGRLEERLAAAAPKPKTPSRAPAPITPLTGASPVATDVPSAQDNIGDWIAKRRKQVYGKR